MPPSGTDPGLRKPRVEQCRSESGSQAHRDRRSGVKQAPRGLGPVLWKRQGEVLRKGAQSQGAVAGVGGGSGGLGPLVNTVFMGRHPGSPCVTSQGNTRTLLCARSSPPAGTTAAGSERLSPTALDSLVPPQAPQWGVREGEAAEVTRRHSGEPPGCKGAAPWEGCGPPSEGLGFEHGLCHPPPGSSSGDPRLAGASETASTEREGRRTEEGDALGSPGPGWRETGWEEGRAQASPGNP